MYERFPPKMSTLKNNHVFTELNIPVNLNKIKLDEINAVNSEIY